MQDQLLARVKQTTENVAVTTPIWLVFVIAFLQVVDTELKEAVGPLIDVVSPLPARCFNNFQQSPQANVLPNASSADFSLPLASSPRSRVSRIIPSTSAWFARRSDSIAAS